MSDDKAGRAPRAYVFGSGEEHAFKSIASGGGEVPNYLADAQDEFGQDYKTSGKLGVIQPPFNQTRLHQIVLTNNALEPCVAIMESNVSGTGFVIEHRIKAESELTDADKERRDLLYAFLEEVDVETSFTTLRRALRRDLHTYGNAYLIVERTLTGEVAFLRRGDPRSMRLVNAEAPQRVAVTVRGQTFYSLRAERRFVQCVAQRYLYYKEFGGSQDVNHLTGAWGSNLPAKDKGHEVVWFRDVPDANSPYGLPRWITQLPSVLGSRLAEEQNISYFKTGGTPPALIFVSGGMMTDQVVDTLRTFFTPSTENRNRVGVIEVPGTGDIDGDRPANITVERFGQGASADAAFDTYDEKCEIRVRRAFRLSKMFVGQTEGVNYASAMAAIQLTEDQVFAPERQAEDERFNLTIMRAIDPTGEWVVKSNAVSLTDAATQLVALGILAKTEGVSVSEVVSETARVGHVGVYPTDDMEGKVVGAQVNAGSPPPGAGQDDAPDGEPDDDEEDEVAAKTVALRMKRAAEEMEDGDAVAAERMLALRAPYTALRRANRDAVNRALGAAMFHVSLIGNAALNSAAGSYADCLFQEAERVRDEAQRG